MPKKKNPPKHTVKDFLTNKWMVLDNEFWLWWIQESGTVEQHSQP